MDSPFTAIIKIALVWKSIIVNQGVILILGWIIPLMAKIMHKNHHLTISSELLILNIFSSPNWMSSSQWLQQSDDDWELVIIQICLFWSACNKYKHWKLIMRDFEFIWHMQVKYNYILPYISPSEILSFLSRCNFRAGKEKVRANGTDGATGRVSGEPVQTTTHNEAFKDLTTTETDTMTDRKIMWVSQE